MRILSVVSRAYRVVYRASGSVRWRMTAILAFTGTSTILVACLSVATLDVMVRREGANVVEKQIELLVQESRSVSPIILNQAGTCSQPASSQAVLKSLLAYTADVFPYSRTSVTVEGESGVQFLASGTARMIDERPGWLEAGFDGLAVNRGQIEIRHVLTQQKGACRLTVVFSLPLGAELAKRLSFASKTESAPLQHRPFHVHAPDQ